MLPFIWGPGWSQSLDLTPPVLARANVNRPQSHVLVRVPAEHDSRGVSPKDQQRKQFGDTGWGCPRVHAALDDFDGYDEARGEYDKMVATLNADPHRN